MRPGHVLTVAHLVEPTLPPTPAPVPVATSPIQGAVARVVPPAAPPPAMGQGTAPPLGGLYEGIVRLSVLGRQHIAIHIVSSTLLELQLDGVVQLPSTAMQYRCDEGGTLELELPDVMRHLMRRLHARFDGARWVAESDHAIFTVTPLGLRQVHVRLSRVASVH
jgi:hypothetical protein